LDSSLAAVTRQLLAALPAARDAAAMQAASNCCSLLLRCHVAAGCQSVEQLPALCSAAVHMLLQAQQQPGVSAAATTAAAEVTAALCHLQSPDAHQLLSQLAQSPLLSQQQLPQLPLQQLLALHAAAAAAGQAALASAALHALLEPSVLMAANSNGAAQLLVQLADAAAAAPLGDAAGQQQRCQQQCLCCLVVIVREAGRAVEPAQLVPLLRALRTLQQQQQQQQQLQPDAALGQVAALHREAVAAACLHLQDCASFLAPADVSAAVQSLALLRPRPVPLLALSALVQAAACGLAAAQQQPRYSLRELVPLLWGLAKLRYTGQRTAVQQLLSAALQLAVHGEPATAAAAAGVDEARLQSVAAGDAGGASSSSSSSGSSGSSSGSSSSRPQHAFIDAAVTVLWVAATIGCQDGGRLLQLLHVLLQGRGVLRPAQLASMLWSYTRLSQRGLQQQTPPQEQQQQQQQQQLSQQWLALRRQVLQAADAALVSSSGVPAGRLLPKHAVNIIWALHKLSECDAACCCASCLQQGLLGSAASTWILLCLPFCCAALRRPHAVTRGPCHTGRRLLGACRCASRCACSSSSSSSSSVSRHGAAAAALGPRLPAVLPGALGPAAATCAAAAVGAAAGCTTERCGSGR
jgi:uncharacterized membrane protein YgcG